MAGQGAIARRPPPEIGTEAQERASVFILGQGGKRLGAEIWPGPTEASSPRWAAEPYAGPVRGAKAGPKPRSRTLVTPAAWLAVAVVTTLGPRALAAHHVGPPPPIVAQVKATVSPGLTVIRGTVRLCVHNPTSASLRSVPLWTFPRRLARRPRGLDEVTEEWVFPAGFSPGNMTLGPVSTRRVAASAPGVCDPPAPGSEAPRAAEVRRPASAASPTHVVVLLPAPVAPGETVALDVPFETTVPERFGPFGRAGGLLVADGGWFPRPPPLDTRGFHLHAPPALLRYGVALQVPAPSPKAPHPLAVLNGAVFWPGRPAGRAMEGPPPREGRIMREAGLARWLSLAVFLDGHVTTRPAKAPGGPRDQGSPIILVSAQPPPAAPARRGDPWALYDLGRLDTQREILASAGEALQLWRVANQAVARPARAPSRPPQAPLVLLQVPLRRDIGLAAPGQVLVSDRAFELTPWRALLRLHRAPLVRATVAALAQTRRHLPPLDADFVGVSLTERWERARYGGVEGARAVLGYGAFLAAVDEVIYAPQLPFQRAVFRTVEDTDRFRDRFSLFSHLGASGRQLYEKLLDVAGRLAANRAAVDVLAGVPLADAARRAAPAARPQDVTRWTRVPSPVSYHLGGVLPGRDATGTYTDVEVLRTCVGHDRCPPELAEPVDVVVYDGSSHGARGRWYGPGNRAVVRVRTQTRATRAELDPRGRLLQADVDQAGRPAQGDPRLDDRNFDRWKFLIQGVYAAFTSAAGRLEGSATFYLQRRNDLRHLLVLEPQITAEGEGLGLDYYYGFGPKLRPNMHRGFASLQTTFSHLRGHGDHNDGFGARLEAAVAEVGTLSRVAPERGRRLYLGLGLTLGVTPRATRAAGFFQASATGLLPLGPGQVLAGRLHAASIFAGDSTAAQRWTLGGADQVRAFDAVAARGRHRLLASLEWRHRFSRTLSVDVGHVAFGYALWGAAFVDSALLSDSLAGVGETRSLFVGAGYGLRAQYLALGLTPMLLRLDLAWRIVERGKLAPHPAVPTLVLAVDQPF